MRIVGILLAAGRSERFGSDKLLVALPSAFDDIAPGTPIGVAACRHLVAALPETIAVVRPDDRMLADRLRNAGAHVIECPRAQEGMGASLACGVMASPDASGWIVALADMPWIRPATIQSVAAALAAGADIVAPMYRAERGHPVGFAQRHYAALAASTGDLGARAIVTAHRDQVTLLPTDDAGVMRDIDEPRQL